MRRDALLIGFLLAVLVRIAAAEENHGPVKWVIDRVIELDRDDSRPVTERAFVKVNRRWQEMPAGAGLVDAIGRLAEDPSVTDMINHSATSHSWWDSRSTQLLRMRPFAGPAAPVRHEVAANLPVDTEVSVDVGEKTYNPTLRVTRQDATIPHGEARLSQHGVFDHGPVGERSMGRRYYFRTMLRKRARVPIVRVGRK